MGHYSPEERAFLLKTARDAISASVLPKREPPAQRADDYPSLMENRGCFVTLHKKGALRGCIGTIEPIQPLFACITDNAINAAFGDPRFPAVTAAELSQIEIEISVLSVPEELLFTDEEDLKAKLIPGVHGVILSQGRRSATFLPQVWEQLPEKESFLRHLCMKAGLPGDAWKDRQTRIKVYQVEFFSE